MQGFVLEGLLVEQIVSSRSGNDGGIGCEIRSDPIVFGILTGDLDDARAG